MRGEVNVRCECESKRVSSTKVISPQSHIAIRIKMRAQRAKRAELDERTRVAAVYAWWWGCEGLLVEFEEVVLGFLACC